MASSKSKTKHKSKLYYSFREKYYSDIFCFVQKRETDRESERKNERERDGGRQGEGEEEEEEGEERETERERPNLALECWKLEEERQLNEI